MTLDYTDPERVVNFRDVGEFTNLIAGTDVLPVGRLYRGGTLRHVASPHTVGSPRTVFNLQKGPDPVFPGVRTYHFPISNDYEKYQTRTPRVRAWLADILAVIEQGVAFPLYIHCLSGKDRTGVVVAMLLEVLGVDRDHIVEEYLLSQGEVRDAWIRTALSGIAPIEASFGRRRDLARIRRVLLGLDPHH